MGCRHKAIAVPSSALPVFLALASSIAVDTDAGFAGIEAAPPYPWPARSRVRLAIVWIMREQLFLDLVSLRRAMVSAIAMVGA
jgi:hypothetical protein